MAGREPPRARPVVVPGPAVAGLAPVPDDTAVAAALATPPQPVPPWTRLADVHLRRDGGVLWLVVHPRTGPVACADWRDFVVQLGAPGDDGTRLAAAVRAYFANGGDRCHVATVRHPLPEDGTELEAARADMVGVPDAGVARATGVARLLLAGEVALVAAPDLHAMRPAEDTIVVPLPPSDADADFRPCGPPQPPPEPASGRFTFDEPLYPDPDAVFATQFAMLDLVAQHGLGVELVVTPPMGLDPATGRWATPDAAAADAWRRRFLVPDPQSRDLAFAACYWPWLLTQAQAGDPVIAEPPLGAALGVIARRDLARGPYVAPANEPVRGVVATAQAVTDADHRTLYEPRLAPGAIAGGAVNVLRPFPTRGIELWGGRTLAADRCLRHLSIRRGLSAIERQAAAELADLVFEPNTPLLALSVTHRMATLLLELFGRGALRGDTAEEAFSVRCDDSVNPPESVDAGRLVCEVGVALAAPAEFILFRLARHDAGVQVVEP